MGQRQINLLRVVDARNSQLQILSYPGIYNPPIQQVIEVIAVIDLIDAITQKSGSNNHYLFSLQPISFLF
jgi:hypothetical protein